MKRFPTIAGGTRGEARRTRVPAVTSGTRDEASICFPVLRLRLQVGDVFVNLIVTIGSKKK